VITQGPLTLTKGQAVDLNDPSTGVASVALQIQNATPFLIFVYSGANLYSIQPYIAQTIPAAGGQTVVVNPQNSVALASNGLTVVWLLAGETAPMEDGPLAVIAGTGSDIATISYSVDVNNSDQILVPVPGLVYVLYQLDVFNPAAGAATNGQVYQSATGAVPAPAGSVLYTFPGYATGAPFSNSFGGYPLTEGNGLYITESSTTNTIQGTLQLTYSTM
jgi:hypothetical protein